MLTLKFQFPINEMDQKSTGSWICEVDRFIVSQWESTDHTKFTGDTSAGFCAVGDVPAPCFEGYLGTEKVPPFKYHYVQAHLSDGRSLDIISVAPVLYVMNAEGKTIDTYQL